MREIKFRTHTLAGGMQYFDDLEDFCYAYDSGFMYNEKIMQYTGLKDKNGKEIYEGDIVAEEELIGYQDWKQIKVIVYEVGTDYELYGSYIGFVLKEPECFGEKIDSITDKKYGKGFFRKHKAENVMLRSNGEILEVIGNIYENPDIIENARDELDVEE